MSRFSEYKGFTCSKDRNALGAKSIWSSVCFVTVLICPIPMAEELLLQQKLPHDHLLLQPSQQQQQSKRSEMEEHQQEQQQQQQSQDMILFDPEEAMAKARHEFGEHGGVNMSIEASATFTVMEAETMGKMFRGELGPERDFYIYSRHFNPTVLALGRQIAAMEGTEAAYCTASGMSAIASVLLQLCSSGDHIVASNRVYGGTHALLRHFLPRAAGVHTTFVDITDVGQVRAAVQEGKTRVVYCETVANPTLAVADVAAVGAAAREGGAVLVVDNTFAPLVVSPARLGADVVVLSLTKFAGGGADAVAGAVCAAPPLLRRLSDTRGGALMLLGPTMDPGIAFRVATRLPHLPLRMREHGRRALALATRLRAMGLKVIYPGLDDHPQHELFKRQANPGYGYGGVLCVDLHTVERANLFMNHLQNASGFGLMAVSLGYSETLMSCSGSSTSSELDDSELHAAGISPGLVRLSIGYTGSLEQRWLQLKDAILTLGLVDDNSSSSSNNNSNSSSSNNNSNSSSSNGNSPSDFHHFHHNDNGDYTATIVEH